MRVRARLALPLAMSLTSLSASGQDREVPMGSEDTGAYGAVLGATGVRVSGFFVGSANYNSHVQLVPEFAGSGPLTSERGQ